MTCFTELIALSDSSLCICMFVVHVYTCMLSVYSVRFYALQCVSIDFVCVHLLLHQFFDFLEFPKFKQLNPFALKCAFLRTF